MSYAVFPSGPFQTNAYLLFCPETQEAVIIDPAPESELPLVEFIQSHQLKPKAIWLTHSHWDHIADAAPLIKRYKIPLFVHEEDAPNVENPGSDRLPLWVAIEEVTPSGFFKEKQELFIGKQKVQVIHTPGHTPGGVCFYLPQANLLFSGDTMFKGTIGNLSFPTARPSLMWQSLSKLAKLPSNVVVLPGHGPSTTIGQEPWLEKAEDYFS